MRTIEFKVQSLGEDPRLDKVIPLHQPELSRSMARKVIEQGGVYVNQKRCKKNAKALTLGDRIKIVFDAVEKTDDFELSPEGILFENKDWIVVNKPPHLPTHETIDDSRHHLALAVQKHLALREKKPHQQVYLGIHHRLDRDTSGVILFTKRKEANAAVAMAFQNREVQKTYLAVSVGKLLDPKTITSFLGTHPKNKRMVASVQRGGKYAETEISALAHKKDLTLVRAKPKTGRTHQIRVHLAENQLPILGDRTYGIERHGVNRVLLHAWRLELLGHTFEAPVPEDFRQLQFSGY